MYLSVEGALGSWLDERDDAEAEKRERWIDCWGWGNQVGLRQGAGGRLLARRNSLAKLMTMAMDRNGEIGEM